MSTEAAKRFVPGAPPPPPVSKSQKKKRRTAKKDEDPISPEVSIPDTHAAALKEKAPAEQDVTSGRVAEELVVHSEPAKEEQQLEQGVAKPSPVVDLLNKRYKQLTKKIVCPTVLAALRECLLKIYFKWLAWVGQIGLFLTRKDAHSRLFGQASFSAER